MTTKPERRRIRKPQPNDTRKKRPLPPTDVTTMYDTLTLGDYNRLRGENLDKAAPVREKKQKGNIN